MKSLRVVAIAFFLCAGGRAAAADAAPTLTVSISGAESQDGVIIVAIFDDEDNFLKQPIRFRTAAIETDGSAEAVFTSVPVGRYAVSAIHDADENGELTLGLLGIPREDYGFSNDARGRFGPPGFDSAAFAHEQPTTIEISLGGV